MSKAWLKDLEEKVQEATARLRELREENDGLRQQVEELEAQLADRPEGEGGEGWGEEREEIRGRVERLVDHLSELLEE